MLHESFLYGGFNKLISKYQAFLAKLGNGLCTKVTNTFILWASAALA